MYESPINLLVSNIEHQIRDEQERCVLEAVQRVGVTVDKEELEKALQYDRRQYENGYRDALRSVWQRMDTLIHEIGDEMNNA